MMTFSVQTIERSGSLRRKAVWLLPGLLALASVAVWATGGGRVTIGPFTLSASSASRLAFQAVALAAAIHAFARSGSAAAGAAICTALALAAAMDSTTRRVGDGLEYLAMATRLGDLGAPSVTIDDLRAIGAEAGGFGDATWHGALDPTLRGADGRHDFPHFWIYPAFAAPFVAAARLLGAHPAIGFTALHLVLISSVSFVVIRRAGYHVALLLLCVLLWWVDKAHAETFIVTLTTLGMLWLELHPRRSAVAFAIVTAQMPVLAPVLAGAIALLPWRARLAQSAAVAMLCAAIAALHPVYYLSHLGRLSPLQAASTFHVPGLRALVTPLVDPNLGIVWYATMLAILAVIGIAGRPSEPRRSKFVAAIGFVTLVLAAASTPNVNHGGTPGPSRYGLWCVGIAAPLIAEGVRRAAPARAGLVAAGSVLTLAFSAAALHPRHQDSGIGPHPSALARLLWTRAPWLDNPLPEVFAERVAHIDGGAPLPIATAGCEKALLIADGETVWWPKQCRPVRVPAACATAGAYCYVNGRHIVQAPAQAGFAAPLAPERTAGPR